jgi:hypothetical protein
MSVRSGTPQFTVRGAVALGGASGIALSLGNGNVYATLNSLLLTYTATATVGNRIPIVRVQAPVAVNNPALVVLWQLAFAAVTAGQVATLQAGSGVPASTVTVPLMQFVTLPFDMPLPINSQIQILDSANIDPADTVSMVANLAV